MVEGISVSVERPGGDAGEREGAGRQEPQTEEGGARGRVRPGLGGTNGLEQKGNKVTSKWPSACRPPPQGFTGNPGQWGRGGEGSGDSLR